MPWWRRTAGFLERTFWASLMPEAVAGSLLVLPRRGSSSDVRWWALVALTKLLVSVVLRGPENWMDRVLPVVSMAGICFIIAIITARSQEKLLTVGAALIAAAIVAQLHRLRAGILVRQAGAGSIETTCRTVAIEVGLQNGGMASGLAMYVLKSPLAALAPAIFGPWMNISGSMLAAWWHRRPVGDGAGGQVVVE